ncbi:MAG TPA: DUF1304 family protein [Beijerinckiaceae bacterium]|jgi:uncharacterized membrane protein
MMTFLRIVAGIGALLQLGFAYQETFGWGPKFVKRVAEPWIDPAESEAATEGHIAWARRLAFNIGVYNLALAIGLAWTFYAAGRDPAAARTLGLFLAVWLLVAAAAAAYTKVYAAAALQGALGVFLLIAIWQ